MKKLLLPLFWLSLLAGGNAKAAGVGPLTEAQAFAATCKAFANNAPSEDAMVVDFLRQFCTRPPSGEAPVEIKIGQLDGVREIEAICQSHPHLLALAQRTPCGRAPITQEQLQNSSRAVPAEAVALQTLGVFHRAIANFNRVQTEQFLRAKGQSEAEIAVGQLAMESLQGAIEGALTQLQKGEISWGAFNQIRLRAREVADLTINGLLQPATNP